MASKGVVRLNGRFQPGTKVRLVKVKDESVLRAEGGTDCGSAVVDEDGWVEFDAEPGGRYFIVGQNRGEHVEARSRGNVRGEEDDSVLSQAPVAPNRTKLTSGAWADERPERQDPHHAPVVPGLHQVPEGTPLASDTPHGSAHAPAGAEQEPRPKKKRAAKAAAKPNTETKE